MSKTIRDLEQTNDEFESKTRQLEMTLENANAAADSKLEENALLQSDIEDQNNTIQHLREELKGRLGFILSSYLCCLDLKMEVEVMRTRSGVPNGHSAAVPASPEPQADPAAAQSTQAAAESTQAAAEALVQAETSVPAPASPQRTQSAPVSVAGTPTRPGLQRRGSALEIVRQLLSRVTVR